MKEIFPLILGMSIVTYLPRLIPLVLLKDREINPNIEKFLLYIPFTSLAILITKGVMETEVDMLLPTIIGLGAAGLASWIKGNLVLSVLTGILSSLIVLNVLA